MKRQRERSEMGTWDITQQLLEIEAVKTDAILQTRLRELGWMKKPVIDWVATDAPDPRDAYTTRINGHVVGIHASEEAARNHAWALEGYLGMVDTSTLQEGK